MGTIPASLLRLFAPIEHLLTDPSVRRVMVDGPDRVFIERDGHTERVGVAYDAAALAHSLRGLAERAGKPFDAQRPCLEAMLKDGTRFLALCSPVVDGGPVLAISLPGGHAATLSGLVQAGALTGGAARTLGLALRAGLNIIVAGPPGGGRARLLEALCAELPPEARVATLQDGGALTLPGRPAIRLTPRKSEGEGRTVTGGDLLYCAGRMAVDRVVVADLRLADGWDAASLLASRAAPMLLGLPAMTPTDALSRLAALARASAARERDRAGEGLIAAGVDLIVLVGRWGEAPPVLSIDAVEARDGVPVLVPLFTRRDADDVLAATPSVEPLRARWQRLVPPSAPVGATRIERVDPPQPGAETRVERAAGERPDGERLARAAASGEVDPDAGPGTSDEAPTADAPPQASDERPAVDAPAVDPPNRDEAPLAADAPSPPPEAALDESVDISVDLPPAAGAEGKTTEALAMDVPFAAPALSVEAPSLSELAPDGDISEAPDLSDLDPSPAFAQRAETADHTPDLGTTQAIDLPHALTGGPEPSQAAPPEASATPDDSLAGGSALHRLLESMERSPAPDFHEGVTTEAARPEPPGAPASPPAFPSLDLDDEEDDEDEPTVITGVGVPLDAVSKKTFSQVLKSLGSPDDSVEADMDSWRPSTSDSMDNPTREVPRVRDRNTLVHKDDD